MEIFVGFFRPSFVFGSVILKLWLATSRDSGVHESQFCLRKVQVSSFSEGGCYIDSWPASYLSSC